MLAYSYYQPENGGLELASPSSFWSKGFVRKTPDDKRIFEQADAFDVDVVLTYFFKMHGGRYSSNYEFRGYLLDAKRRQVYSKDGNQNNIDAITADLFSEFLK